VPERGPQWALENFLECFDRWAANEEPSDDARVLVMHWILSRAENPYLAVRRETGFANLWFGAIPGTLEADGTVVACAYWIIEEFHKVRCDSFATLSTPL
jgi:hypothetical protein